MNNVVQNTIMSTSTDNNPTHFSFRHTKSNPDILSIPNLSHGKLYYFHIRGRL